MGPAQARTESLCGGDTGQDFWLRYAANRIHRTTEQHHGVLTPLNASRVTRIRVRVDMKWSLGVTVFPLPRRNPTIHAGLRLEREGLLRYGGSIGSPAGRHDTKGSA